MALEEVFAIATWRYNELVSSCEIALFSVFRIADALLLVQLANEKPYVYTT